MEDTRHTTRINPLSKLKRHDEAIKLARRLYYKAEELYGPSEENFRCRQYTRHRSGAGGKARLGKLRQGRGYDSEFTLRIHWTWTIWRTHSAGARDPAARRLAGKGPFTQDVEKGMESVRGAACLGRRHHLVVVPDPEAVASQAHVEEAPAPK